MTAKPTVAELGIDLAAQVWHRSGRGDGTIEVAFAHTGHSAANSGNSAAEDPAAGDAAAGDAAAGDAASEDPAAGDAASEDPAAGDAEWVLLRVAGDGDQRVLVFDRHEWECFLDGARNGEFDDAAANP